MKTVTITFPLREQVIVITVAEHAKQASPPPLTFPEHRCMLDIIEGALNAQDFGLQQPVTPALKDPA